MDHRASQKRGRQNEMGERIKKRWKALEAHCAVHFSLRLQFFRMTKAVIHKTMRNLLSKPNALFLKSFPYKNVAVWMVILQYTGQQKSIWTHKSHLKMYVYHCII